MAAEGQGNLLDDAARSRLDRAADRLALLENGLRHLEAAIPAMARECAELRAEVDVLRGVRRPGAAEPSSILPGAGQAEGETT